MLRKVSGVPVRIFGSTRAIIREVVGQRRASVAAAPRPKLNTRPNPLIPSTPAIDPMKVGIPVLEDTEPVIASIQINSPLFEFDSVRHNPGTELSPLDTTRLSILAALLEANHSLRLCTKTTTWNYVVVHHKVDLVLSIRLENDNFVTSLNGEELVIPRSALARSEFSMDEKQRLVNVNAPSLCIHGRGLHPTWTIGLNGQAYDLAVYLPHVHDKLPLMPEPVKAIVIKDIHSPLAGVVTVMRVKEGDRVKKGQEICILEAMKMQNNLIVADDGIVTRILADVGSTVADGELIVKID